LKIIELQTLKRVNFKISSQSPSDQHIIQGAKKLTTIFSQSFSKQVFSLQYNFF